MRPETVRRYADEAGFASCEVLPIEHDFWRFYLLQPWAPVRGSARRSPTLAGGAPARSCSRA